MDKQVRTVVFDIDALDKGDDAFIERLTEAGIKSVLVSNVPFEREKARETLKNDALSRGEAPLTLAPDMDRLEGHNRELFTGEALRRTAAQLEKKGVDPTLFSEIVAVPKNATSGADWLDIDRNEATYKRIASDNPGGVLVVGTGRMQKEPAEKIGLQFLEAARQSRLGNGGGESRPLDDFDGLRGVLDAAGKDQPQRVRPSATHFALLSPDSVSLPEKDFLPGRVVIYDSRTLLNDNEGVRDASTAGFLKRQGEAGTHRVVVHHQYYSLNDAYRVVEELEPGRWEMGSGPFKELKPETQNRIRTECIDRFKGTLDKAGLTNSFDSIVVVPMIGREDDATLTGKNASLYEQLNISERRHPNKVVVVGYGQAQEKAVSGMSPNPNERFTYQQVDKPWSTQAPKPLESYDRLAALAIPEKEFAASQRLQQQVAEQAMRQEGHDRVLVRRGN